MDVKDQLEQALEQVNRGLRTEVRETKRFARYLLKRWRHEATTPEEQEEAREQLRDLIRLPPLLLLFALPGGAFIILGLERMLPLQSIALRISRRSRPTTDQMNLSRIRL